MPLGRAMTLLIILADDHPIVLNGVRMLLENGADATVVANANSPVELIDAIETHPCDLVITDFSMPGSQLADGLHMLGLIRRRWPTLPVIVLTMVSNAGVLGSILATGVRGLLSKSDALTELTLAVRAVSQDRDYLSKSVKKTLDASRAGGAGTAVAALSKRE